MWDQLSGGDKNINIPHKVVINQTTCHVIDRAEEIGLEFQIFINNSGFTLNVDHCSFICKVDVFSFCLFNTGL